MFPRKTLHSRVILQVGVSITGVEAFQWYEQNGEYGHSGYRQQLTEDPEQIHWPMIIFGVFLGFPGGRNVDVCDDDHHREN